MLDLKTIVSHNKFKYAKNVFEDLSHEPYAVIKGEALSLLAYGALGKRHVGDIDLLISRNNLKNIIPLFEKDGFQTGNISRSEYITMLTYSHQTPPLIKKISECERIMIDINFDIFWGEYEGKRVDIGEFLCDAMVKSIYGVEVKTLTPLKMLVQLILHNYKDMNSIFLIATRKYIDLEMFRDVYNLLVNNLDSISLESLYAISVKYQIVPYVYYVLYYTNQVIPDDILEQYVKVFKTREGESLLNCYGLCEKERKKWKYDFSTRMKTANLRNLIEDDLTSSDKDKIEINRLMF